MTLSDNNDDADLTGNEYFSKSDVDSDGNHKEPNISMFAKYTNYETSGYFRDPRQNLLNMSIATRLDIVIS